MEQQLIRILLLGSPRIEQDGAALNLERRKALALLAYLALAEQPQARESLAALFWPDYEQARAAAYLRNTLWTISRTLGEGWAIVEGDSVRFNAEANGPNVGLYVDALHFQQLLRAAKQAESLSRMAALSEAAALYRADFMAGFALPDAPEFEEWQFMQADALRRELSDALETLAEMYIQTGDLESALMHTRRWLALDPLHEPAQRQMMRLYAWLGRHTAALRQYREVVSLLGRELNTPPEPETTNLFEQIQTRRLPGPPAADPTAAQASTTTISAPAPALTMARAVPNLPPQTTPFVGREREIAELVALLGKPDCRLVTLVGPGGIGKTRLAIQAAGQVGAQFADGVQFVALAPVSSSEFLLPTLATALGFSIDSKQDLQTELGQFLHQRRMLIVMDNFEHLLDGVGVIADILSRAPGVGVLATSRERLNLAEEWLYEVGGLAFPEAGAAIALEDYEGFSAIELFVQSARRVRPTFNLAAADLPVVAGVCRITEGMPLGIELAATWVQMLTVQEIAREIERSLDFLTTTLRNVPERHRSLRAVFEYSWRLLIADEQAALSRLSVFRGGFSLEAAQAVAGAALHLLLALIGKSLLRRSAAGLFEMHELLRQFTAHKLDEADRADTLDRHYAYYAEFLQRQTVQLRGDGQVQALDAIQSQFDNIRAAWQRAIFRGDVAAISRSIEALHWFYDIRGSERELSEFLQYVIDGLNPASDRRDERFLCALVLALLARRERYADAIAHVDDIADRSLALLDEFREDERAIWPLLNIATAKSRLGMPSEQAEQLAREALALAERHGNRFGIGIALEGLGWIMHTTVYYAEAMTCFERSLAVFREIGNPWGITIALNGLAENAYTVGDYERARLYTEAQLPLLEQLGDRLAVRDRTSMLTFLRNQHDTHEQELALRQALEVYREFDDKPRIAGTVYELGVMALFDGRLDEAEALLAESFAVQQRMNTPTFTAWTRLFQGALACERGQFAEAREHVADGLALVAGMHFPWVVAGADYILGDVALAEGNVGEARRLYAGAVRLAHSVQSIMQTLRHLTGLAETMLIEGQPGEALVLAAFVSEHPAHSPEAVRRSARIIHAATQQLSTSERAAAQERARQMTIDEAVGLAAEGVS